MADCGVVESSHKEVDQSKRSDRLSVGKTREATHDLDKG